jgi:hypothetical protein
MPSMFFDNTGNASGYIINDNVEGSYPVSIEDFNANPDVKLWFLDTGNRLPRLKTAGELAADALAEKAGFFDNINFLLALGKEFTPLEMESLAQRFQTFRDYIGFQNWPAIKAILTDKITNNIITPAEYTRLNNVFKKFNVNLDSY